MLTENSINRQLNLRKSLDYHQLREAGIVHLQELAGKIWSDYNTHDPGVTLLETLCYAITDLSYRCNFPIEDLLAGNSEKETDSTSGLFEAHQILPSHPLTILDFRKILVDLPYVRNAWLEPADSDGPDIYYNENQKKLTYEQTDDNGLTCEKISLRGLYNIWIDLADDKVLGNLNANSADFDIEIVDAVIKHPARVTVFFPHFSDLSKAWKNATAISNITTHFTLNPDPEYDLNVTVGATSGETELDEIQLKIVIDAGEFHWRVKETQVRNKIADHLKAPKRGLLAQFLRKTGLINQHLTEVRHVLGRHRNLCEDFEQINLVKPQEIAVLAEIGLSLDADPNQVIAKALYEINNYFSPPIRFNSLSQLLDEKLSPEEIFEGPLLRHGFIKDENLTAFRQGKIIFVSDIFNLFISSNPDKIKYVTGFKLSNYIENIQISSPNGDQLQLHRSDDYKPTVSLRKSRIYCKKGDVYQKVDWHKVEQIYDLMAQAGAPDKSYEPDHRLDVPEGRDRNVVHYTSIQEELPPNYGVGTNGLPANATDERKALALQLKGYLLFFDRLFANFLAQLANLKNLYSLDSGVTKTYFEQAVYNVPDAMRLLKDFIAPLGEGSQQALLEEAWKIFTADTGNEYISALGKMNEDMTTFLDRRNRFLDHLMARFNEQFTDYSLLMFAGHNSEIPSSLLTDKINFLKEYPELSRRRAAAFYAAGGQDGVWNTENVTGLEKRVSRMLGFVDYKRRFLTKGAFGNIRFYQELDNDNIDEFRFRILSEDNRILLSSHRHYRILNNGYDIVFRILDYGKDEANYKIFKARNNAFYFNLTDAENRILARRIQPFANEEDAQAAVAEVAAFIKTKFEGLNDEPDEGFFVIENLLLRPKNNEIIEGEEIKSVLLPVFSDDYGEIITEGKDPYSFRITVVFPAQLEKFKDQNFNALAEHIVRLETPAHIMPHIYFLNNLPLSRLEHAYKYWLELNAMPVPDEKEAMLAHFKKLNMAQFELEGAMQFVPDEPAF